MHPYWFGFLRYKFTESVYSVVLGRPPGEDNDLWRNEIPADMDPEIIEELLRDMPNVEKKKEFEVNRMYGQNVTNLKEKDNF